MLRHKLSCPKSRLLLSVLMLKDAGRNHHAVAGVDTVVSHESGHLADDGHVVLLDQLRHLSRVGHALVAPHRNVHRFGLPPSHRGRADQTRLKLMNGANCEGLGCLEQLPRTRYMRTSENSVKAKFVLPHS